MRPNLAVKIGKLKLKNPVMAASGTLSVLETLPALPADAPTKGNAGAHILVSPSGRFVYASIRGYDHIVIYSISPDNGHMSLVGRENGGGETACGRKAERHGAAVPGARGDRRSG